MFSRGRRTHEQRRRRRLVRAELWRGRWLIAGAGVWLVGAAITILLIPLGSASLRAFAAGTLVASWGWMVYVTSILRTYTVTMGEWGESFTRELLAGRKFRWPVIDDVPMEHRNVDHVAVSPRAVLAIETKFIGAGRQWATDQNREAAMRGARSSARSVRLILRSHGITAVPVEPVLMLWGPGTPNIAGGWHTVDGVHVVRGASAGKEWRQHFGQGEVGSVADRVTEALKRHREMRDAHDNS